MLTLHAAAPAGSALAHLIERSMGRPESYRDIMARNTCMAEARELGIRVPDTFPAANEDELNAALAAFHRLGNAPSPLRSVARAAKRRDAHFLLDAVRPPRPAVTVQRFIEGT